MKFISLLLITIIIPFYAYADSLQAQQRLLSSTLGMLSEIYVEEIDDEKMDAMVRHAIKGMLSQLDKDSIYLTPEEMDLFVWHFTGDGISVSHEWFGRVLYIKIETFTKNVVGEVNEILRDQNPKGLIIDLRDNYGGRVDQAIEMVDMFVDEGLILEVRSPSENKMYEAMVGNALPISTPVVILVNEKTASSAEIVASSLRFLRGATIVGTKTFGKATIQHVFPLANGGGLKITTGHYYTGSGIELHDVGVIPDIVSENDSCLQRALELIEDR